MGILNLLYKITKKYRKYYYNYRKPQNIKILGMLRIRNEELILQDTLEHLSSFCDAIICFDDASTDCTFKILKQHPKVIAIIRNFVWLSTPEERILSETLHRSELLKLSQNYNPEWILCADADERYIGDIRKFVASEEAKEIDAIRVSLFDAYLTQTDQQAYEKQQKLMNFRTYFGPERRDILMLWKNNKEIKFIGSDCREPVVPMGFNIDVKFYCQHYGKSLSINHWEETCDYYIKHFPIEPYGRKWMERKGKAIHYYSDFGEELYKWGNELFDNAIVIHPGG